MAFPIPSHLPRRAAPPQDVPSVILGKLDAATSTTLNASLAASWLQELDHSIGDTKKQIHDRIHDDLPRFEQQETSAKSVQTRLHSLATDVNDLVNKLSRPETGLVPTLIDTLTKHAALQQQTTDAQVLHDCLDHLARFRTALTELDSLTREGRLPQAVAAYQAMDKLLEEHPRPLVDSDILADLKAKFRATRARVEDQLSDAYDRSIRVSSDVLIILPTIQVRQSQTVISFSDILSALSPSALLNHLNLLRRDIMSLYVVRLFDQHCDLTLEEHKITCSPGSSSRDALDNVSSVLTFLSTHLFAALPSPQDVQFPLSLRKPLTQSVLNNLLIPSLPSSFDPLPLYLEFVKKAVRFEEELVHGVLGSDQTERIIENWANGVDGHYERQRRLLILDAARHLMVSPSSKFGTFTVEVELELQPPPSVVPVQESGDMPEDDAWGLADESKAGVDENMEKGAEEVEVEADGWGFDDEAMDTDPSPEHEGNGNGNGNGNAKAETEDPADSWGWNDDSVEDEDDDPWANPPEDEADKPIPVTSPPKVANGLMKKDKKHINGGSSPTPSPSISPPAVPQKPPEKRPPALAPSNPQPLKESYLVSSQMTEILKMIEGVLHEGSHLAASHIFRNTSNSPGALVTQAAPSILDLYRAMYPVVFGTEMKSAVDIPMRFSNNCLYLSSELEKVAGGAGVAQERLRDVQRRLKVLSDSWYYDTIDQQRESVDKLIAEGAAGFTFTADQDRYDECEAALSRTLVTIKLAASRWRGVLTKSKYYTAIGSITEAALTRVLDDITALPDITEVESHQLSELCKILYAVEGLFMEDQEQSSFVLAYVPSWLKFSYLSELLEASMADIKELFEEGALVDFEIDELVRLVRALFADTHLRTETINKLMTGHPTPSSAF